MNEQQRYLIINGLYRSGTTMLERLIDSQPSMICFSHFLEIPDLLARMRGSHKTVDLLQQDSTLLHQRIAAEVDSVPDPGRFVAREICNYAYREISPNSGHRNILHGIDVNDFLKASFTAFRDIKSLNMSKIFQCFDLPDSLVATKWTACHTYASIGIEDESVYWIDIVRNPIDRYKSVLVSHFQNSYESAKLSKHHFDFCNNFSHPRYKLIKYEDFVNDPDSYCEYISDFLDREVRNMQLVEIDGTSWRGNSSFLSDKTDDKNHNPKAGEIGNETITCRAIKRADLKIATTDIVIIESLLGSANMYPMTELPDLIWTLAKIRIKIANIKNSVLRLVRLGGRALLRYL